MSDHGQSPGQATTPEEQQQISPSQESAGPAVTSPLQQAVLHRKIARRLLARRGAGEIAPDAGSAVERAAGASGSPLPANLQEKFGGALGADLSGVRVHTGGDSAAAAESVSAKAYTVGSDIHFGAGQYDPSSSSGQHLLAHEVAHTAQQGSGGGGGGKQPKLEGRQPGDAQEVQADSFAAA